MKIAILYICTGRYDIFWVDFQKNIEMFFLQEHQKSFFVFTDSQTIESSDNVEVLYQSNLGWPFNTLYRFRMFLRIKETLKTFDYIFFFNANMLCVRPINEHDILGADLIVLNHPGFWDKGKQILPFETNPNSTAFINPQEIINAYYQGALNGGKAKAYLQLIQECHDNIEQDLDKGIVAVWHDESHLNKYLIGKEKKVLSPAFGYPEGWDLPFAPQIISRDKHNMGGHDYLRGLTNTKLNFISKLRNYLINKLPI
jgi:hypothetical protein